jgi:hypothetical protein
LTDAAAATLASRSRAKEVPPETIVVLLQPLSLTGCRPPATRGPSGSVRSGCRGSRRPGRAQLCSTWRVERPQTREGANFYDHIHMRSA